MKSRAVLAVFAVAMMAASACSSDPGDDRESDAVEESGADDADAVEESGADDAGSVEESGADEAGSVEAEIEPEASSDSEEGTSQAVTQVISGECPIVEPAESVSVDAMIWEIPVTALYGAELEECSSGSLSVTSVLLPLADAQPQIEAELAKDASDVEIYSTTDGTLARHAEEFIDLAAYIDKYWDQFDLGDIPQPIWDAATVDGRVLGVPLFANTLHFFYNSRILAEYDIAPPDNYDELLVACETLRDAGFDDPFNMNVNFAGAREIEFSSILTSLGGTLINDDNTPGWNTDAGLAAANKILAISDTCMSEEGRGFSIDDAVAALRSGALPMARTWADRAAAMDDPEKSDVVAVMEFGPSLRTDAGTPRNAPPFTIYFSIGTDSTVDPELVFRVVMAGADLESQNAAAAHTTVARLSATHPDAPRNSAVAARSMAEGVGPRTKSPALDIARNVIGDAVWAIIADGADPADELAKAEASYIEQATEAGHL